MFDFRYSKTRLAWDIFFFVLYSLILIIQILFEPVCTKLSCACIGAIHAVTFCASLLNDVDFKEQKIKPTVRTTGLFVMMLFFLCVSFKY